MFEYIKHLSPISRKQYLNMKSKKLQKIELTKKLFFFAKCVYLIVFIYYNTNIYVNGFFFLILQVFFHLFIYIFCV